MTDPERVEEPRPDRLPDIKQRFGIGIPGTGVIGHVDCALTIAWLVAEVERLRAEVADMRILFDAFDAVSSWSDFNFVNKQTAEYRSPADD